MKYRVLYDLECTCWDEETRCTSEIIEIGAVKFNAKTFDIVEVYSSFVKPIINTTLSDFCTELTSITQAQVDSAPLFRFVYPEFLAWSKDIPQYLSWGHFDYEQLRMDCLVHALEPYRARRHMNAKHLYTYYTGVRAGGLGKKLKSHGLEFEGTQHRALDDALNTLKLLKSAWENF